ncbi:MAG: hypothetical protein ABIH52_02165 [Candidatus Aenigmatarchaeota archaeon]|nr:hypothetical protein [Nanoarchaeota archaeon]
MPDNFYDGESIQNIERMYKNISKKERKPDGLTADELKEVNPELFKAMKGRGYFPSSKPFAGHVPESGHNVASSELLLEKTRKPYKRIKFEGDFCPAILCTDIPDFESEYEILPAMRKEGLPGYIRKLKIKNEAGTGYIDIGETLAMRFQSIVSRKPFEGENEILDFLNFKNHFEEESTEYKALERFRHFASHIYYHRYGKHKKI